MKAKEWRCSSSAYKANSALPLISVLGVETSAFCVDSEHIFTGGITAAKKTYNVARPEHIGPAYHNIF